MSENTGLTIVDDSDSEETEETEKKTPRVYFNVVLNDDGSINELASGEAAASALQAFIDSRGKWMGVAAESIKNFFDNQKVGVKFGPVSAVIAHALRPYDLSMEDYGAAEKAAKEYIKENSADERAAGKLYCVQRGKGGGMFRWADRKDRPAKK